MIKVKEINYCVFINLSLFNIKIFLKNNILEPVLSAKETLLEGKYNRIILCVIC